jgi:holin-like protein
MITALSLILAFQLVGEILSRALDLPLPGPVVGLCLLVAACILRPSLAARLRPTAQGLLSHLSLFFVPAGVGVVAHWPVLRDHGIGLALAIMGSTLLAIAAGALTFQWVARWTGAVDPSALKGRGDD